MSFFTSAAFFLLLVLCHPLAVFAQGAAPAVQRQEIEVSLDPERHLVSGICRVAFTRGADQAALRLAPHAAVDSVAVNGKAAPFSFARGLLSVKLPEEAPVVEVRYRATFNDRVSTSPAAGEDPSYGVNGAVTREGTFLGGGAYWYPVPEQVPQMRRVKISAPAGIEGITDGRLVFRENSGTETRSLWEEAHPVGVLSLCAGPYRVEQRRVGNIDLYSYFLPDNAGLSARYLDAAAKYLALYRELFGPYPFEKFAVVENFFPTGYGFPSFTLLGGSVIRLPFIVDTSLPHEIAHCWWGNGVDVDQREGNWSEGLVTYLADYLLKERRSAAEGKEYRRQLLIDYASLVTPANEFPLSSFVSRSDPASRAIGYGKGAMLFHMIRKEIGDEGFFNALRAVSRDRMYGRAAWSDFARAFSRSSGKPMEKFVGEWLVRTGGPHLALARVAERREKGGWSVSGEIVQDPPFPLPVPLVLKTDRGGERREVLAVEKEKTPFTLTAASPPKRLLLDPDADVFRILSPGEIPATVNSIKGSTGVVGVVTANCRADRGTFESFLGSLSQGGAPVLEEREFEKGGGRGRDPVFCGIPSDRSLLPPLPEGIEAEADRFTVDGGSFSSPDGLLFVVLPEQRRKGGAAALFLPLSREGAERYAPKVTHYGKYGYLAFSGGSNRAKGTASAAADGVVAEFSPSRK